MVQIEKLLREKAQCWEEARWSHGVLASFGSSSHLDRFHKHHGELLGLFLIFDCCLSHLCQSGSRRTHQPVVLPMIGEQNQNSLLRMAPQPDPALLISSLLHPSQPLASHPLCQPAQELQTQTGPVLSFGISALAHAHFSPCMCFCSSFPL